MIGVTKLISTNSKLDKDGAYKLVGIQLMAGSKKVCRWAGDCAKLCIKTSFLLKQKKAAKAQKKRTSLYFNNKKAFFAILKGEIVRAVLEAYEENKLGLRVRPNVLSDIPELHLEVVMLCNEIERELGLHGFIEVYDYTKNPRNQYENFTYSYNEKTTEEDFAWNIKRRNIAVVFDTKRGKELPKTFKGFPVIDGDVSDDRLSDPKQKGLIIGLRAKADARKADSKFIVKTKGMH